ncbi:MAG: hypothetical protein LBV23_05500 [Deltaproteobacteria bacterium]|nr:hypothetical protein [Deltaproteobacteria bacterium]
MTVDGAKISPFWKNLTLEGLSLSSPEPNQQPLTITRLDLGADNSSLLGLGRTIISKERLILSRLTVDRLTGPIDSASTAQLQLTNLSLTNLDVDLPRLSNQKFWLAVSAESLSLGPSEITDLNGRAFKIESLSINGWKGERLESLAAKAFALIDSADFNLTLKSLFAGDLNLNTLNEALTAKDLNKSLTAALLSFSSLNIANFLATQNNETKIELQSLMADYLQQEETLARLWELKGLNLDLSLIELGPEPDPLLASILEALGKRFKADLNFRLDLQGPRAGKTTFSFLAPDSFSLQAELGLKGLTKNSSLISLLTRLELEPGSIAAQNLGFYQRLDHLLSARLFDGQKTDQVLISQLNQLWAGLDSPNQALWSLNLNQIDSQLKKFFVNPQSLSLSWTPPSNFPRSLLTQSGSSPFGLLMSLSSKGEDLEKLIEQYKLPFFTGLNLSLTVNSEPPISFYTYHGPKEDQIAIQEEKPNITEENL